MFGIGTTEFLVIIVVAILVLGPEHLPRIMRTVTKVMSDFRRVSTELQRTINLETSQEEWEKQQAEARKTKRKKKKAAPASDAPPKDSQSEPAEPAETHASAEAHAPAGTHVLADELAAEASVSPPPAAAKQAAETEQNDKSPAPGDKTAESPSRGDSRQGADV